MPPHAMVKRDRKSSYHPPSGRYSNTVRLYLLDTIEGDTAEPVAIAP
jgi:hypothetical protein